MPHISPHSPPFIPLPKRLLNIDLYSPLLVGCLGIFFFCTSSHLPHSLRLRTESIVLLAMSAFFFLFGALQLLSHPSSPKQEQPLFWHLGHLALHGFCGWSLLHTQGHEILWLFFALLWLFLSAFYGAFLRISIHQPRGLLAPFLVLTLLLFLADPRDQKLILGVGSLLIEMMFAAGLWKIRQDNLREENQRLLAQVQLYEAWKNQKQQQINQSLVGRMLLDQHQANNLLCGLVLHANVAEAALLNPAKEATQTEGFAQNIKDLAAASRDLQTLFSKPMDLSWSRQFPPLLEGCSFSLLDSFEQAKAQILPLYPQATIHNQAQHSGLLLCPKGELSLSDFFSVIFQELLKVQPQGELCFSTTLPSQSSQQRVRILVKHLQKTAQENLFADLSTSKQPSVLSLIETYLDLCGGCLLESTHTTQNSHFLFELPFQTTSSATVKLSRNEEEATAQGLPRQLSPPKQQKMSI